MAGEGPTILLIHGIAGSSTTWRAVMPALAEHYTVIAPDLLGHGHSAKPRGDYSLGAYASGIRDLLAVLGTRTRHPGRPLPRRRCGHAVRLPVPGVGRTVGAGCVGRAGQGGQPASQGGDPARRRVRAPAPAAPADPGSGRVARRRGPPRRLATERHPGRGVAQLHHLDRSARPDGLHPHRALGDRHRRPAGQRPRPPVPGRGRADPHRLGRPRPDHPRRPRLPGRRGHPRRPARDPPRCRPLPAVAGRRLVPGASSRTSSHRRHPPTCPKSAGASS